MTITMVIPGPPQGKGRARSFVRNGRVGHYTPEKTRTYEGMIRTQAIEAMGAELPYEGPMSLTLCALYPIPKSWPRWKQEMALAGQILPTVKPDLDNVEKAIKDALNGVAWKDDCQVCVVIKQKSYTRADQSPGVLVSFDQMATAPAQCDRKGAA